MGEEDNIIVIFISDNGLVMCEVCKVYELNFVGEIDGLCGCKDNLWEGGICVLVIIKYGKYILQGVVIDMLVYGLDWMLMLVI